MSSLSNYPPGVSGNEPQIVGYDDDEFEFVCPGCDLELTFLGDWSDATAECMNCGWVSVCPGELIQSAVDEARGDAERDGDYR